MTHKMCAPVIYPPCMLTADYVQEVNAIALQGDDSPQETSPRRLSPRHIPSPPTFPLSHAEAANPPGFPRDRPPVGLWESSRDGASQQGGGVIPGFNLTNIDAEPYTLPQKCAINREIDENRFTPGFFPASCLSSIPLHLPTLRAQHSSAYNTLPAHHFMDPHNTSSNGRCTPFTHIGNSIPQQSKLGEHIPPSSQVANSNLPYSIPHFCGGNPALPSASHAIALVRCAVESGGAWVVPPQNSQNPISIPGRGTNPPASFCTGWEAGAKEGRVSLSSSSALLGQGDVALRALPIVNTPLSLAVMSERLNPPPPLPQFPQSALPNGLKHGPSHPLPHGDGLSVGDYCKRDFCGTLQSDFSHPIGYSPPPVGFGPGGRLAAASVYSSGLPMSSEALSFQVMM